ncbi:MAG: hypothetical protein OEY18_12060 [Candidatus Aminicenantes bacterium]|nr:hypothetical protein [Candidatus Aminicenantes bacterium]
MCQICGWPEPGRIMPTAERICSGGIIRILSRHIDMGVPEVAGVRRPWGCSPIPGRILCSDSGGVYKGLVLDDQRNPVIRENLMPEGIDARIVASIDQVLFYLVGQQIGGGHAGIDVEASDPEGMVVVKHQPGTLLVCIVKSHRPIAGIWHVRDIDHAHPFRVGCGFSCRGYPLVGRAVADPDRIVAMKMDCSAVFGVHFHTAVRTHPGPHDGGVHW